VIAIVKIRWWKPAAFSSKQQKAVYRVKRQFPSQANENLDAPKENRSITILSPSRTFALKI
jgi:hypothetical protein